MNNLVEQGKFELKSVVSKRWYIHNVKEFLMSQVPLFGGHPIVCLKLLSYSYVSLSIFIMYSTVTVEI